MWERESTRRATTVDRTDKVCACSRTRMRGAIALEKEMQAACRRPLAISTVRTLYRQNQRRLLNMSYAQTSAATVAAMERLRKEVNCLLAHMHCIFAFFQVAIPHKLLLGPGPTNMPPEVLKAMSDWPPLGHLHPEFCSIMDDVKAGLQYIFDTANQYTFAVSGTGIDKARPFTIFHLSLSRSRRHGMCHDQRD